MYEINPKLHWTRKMRFQAYADVKAAICRGEIPELTEESVCINCGGQATSYDHRDYFYPLTVEPVCAGCNNRRGEGYPPVEGVPLHSNELDFPIRNLAGAGSDQLINDLAISDMRNRASETDDISNKFSSSMPDHRKIAISELSNSKLKILTRGDLRYEYFKKHDPCYICDDVI